MKKEYAVYNPADTHGNDSKDWYTNYKEAFEAAEEMAKELENGESVNLETYTDGEIETSHLEFRMEDGKVSQHKDGQLLWI